MSGVRACILRAKAKVPGVFSAVCTLCVVSVMRQKECSRCKTCQEQRKRFTLAASKTSMSLGELYSNSSLRKRAVIHSVTESGTG